MMTPATITDLEKLSDGFVDFVIDRSFMRINRDGDPAKIFGQE
jgi:hypothetical protein